MYNITSLLYCSVIIYSFSLCIAALNCVATQVRERNGNIAQVCKFQETIVDKLVNWSLNLRWDTVVWTKRWFFWHGNCAGALHLSHRSAALHADQFAQAAYSNSLLQCISLILNFLHTQQPLKGFQRCEHYVMNFIFVCHF